MIHKSNHKKKLFNSQTSLGDIHILFSHFTFNLSKFNDNAHTKKNYSRLKSVGLSLNFGLKTQFYSSLKSTLNCYTLNCHCFRWKAMRYCQSHRWEKAAVLIPRKSSNSKSNDVVNYYRWKNESVCLFIYLRRRTQTYVDRLIILFISFRTKH